MIKKIFILFTLLILAKAAQPPAPIELETEHLVNPIGIDVPAPRLTWRVTHPERGQAQTAYRVIVANKNGTIWDSKQVSSIYSSAVVPANVLVSDASYSWIVMWWDNNGDSSDYSAMAYFDTGLRSQSDWTASWISGQGNLIRRVFSIDDDISRARAYVTGIGYYELYVNGIKVSPPLTPGWTDYSVTVLYNAFDVLPYLVKGDNCIGVMMGHGWYASTEAGEPDGPMSLLFQLQTDNKTALYSNSQWNITQGPIIYDGIYNGEKYDSNLEKEGWNLASYVEDYSWNTVQPAPAPGGALTFQAIAPVAFDTSRPAEQILRPKKKETSYVFDFGQNLSGWTKLNITGKAGTVITLRHAEVLNHDGSNNIYTDNLRTAKATDVYVLKGDAGGEVYEPRFTYHGFRYVEFTADPPMEPSLDTLTSVHYHSAVPQTGFINFTSSSNILNQIQSNILWGQRSNLMSVPTDCDNRDERKGWMGDAQLSGEEALHNYYMSSFYKNFINRIIDEQKEEGSVGDTVPLTFGGNPSDPAWGSAFPSLSLWNSQYYSNTDDLKLIWSAVKKYLSFMDDAAAKNGIGNIYYSYGDWVPPPQFPEVWGNVTSGFSYLANMAQVIQMAERLGDNETYDYYTTSFKKLSSAYHESFWNPSIFGYATGLQTANALPLFLEIVPANVYDDLLNSLLNDLVNNHDTHLTTGIIGTKYLMLALHKIGRDDLALQVAENTDYPSWGYMITNPVEPATTLWELWDTPEEGPGMNSRNHIMFGAVGDWFYKALAGVEQAPGDYDFEQITITPGIVGNLRGVQSSFLTSRGNISVEWALKGGEAVCGTAAQGYDVKLSCKAIGSSGTITGIKFASFGKPNGACGSFNINHQCHDYDSVDIVSKFCVGQSECTIPASEEVFTACGGHKKLYVEAVCDGASDISVNLKAGIPVGAYAAVNLPVLSLEHVTVVEGNNTIYSKGRYVPGVDGVTGASLVGNKIMINVGSGSYDFTLTGEEASVICIDTTENDNINITCPQSDQVISQVQFASFGTPTGQCGSYSAGDCSTGSSVAVVERECLFSNSCQLDVNTDVFGDACFGTGKLFAAQVVCAVL